MIMAPGVLLLINRSCTWCQSGDMFDRIISPGSDVYRAPLRDFGGPVQDFEEPNSGELVVFLIVEGAVCPL